MSKLFFSFSYHDFLPWWGPCIPHQSLLHHPTRRSWEVQEQQRRGWLMLDAAQHHHGKHLTKLIETRTKTMCKETFKGLDRLCWNHFFRERIPEIDDSYWEEARSNFGWMTGHKYFFYYDLLYDHESLSQTYHINKDTIRSWSSKLRSNQHEVICLWWKINSMWTA